jgi:hypothetical protein
VAADSVGHFPASPEPRQNSAASLVAMKITVLDGRRFVKYIYVMENNPKLGRPKLPAGKRRSRPLRIIFTPSEYEAVKAALGTGAAPSVSARNVLLKLAGK